jgi:hypothetical protein
MSTQSVEQRLMGLRLRYKVLLGSGLTLFDLNRR